MAADGHDVHMSRRELVRWSAGAGALAVLGGCGGLEDLAAAVAGPPAGTGTGAGRIARSARAAVEGTYYVDSRAGDDSNHGTDSSAAWRSLARVELAVAAGEIVAGDTVQFRAGSTFLRDEASDGPFWFEGGLLYQGSGSIGRPVFLGSGNRPFGIRGAGTALSDLVLQGGGLSVLRTDGMAPVHVSLTNVDCTDGARIGFQQLSGGGAGSGSTFAIQGGSFSRNGTIGINLTGARDTTVDGVTAADNGTVGIRLQSSGPGCGIRNCLAHGNGANGIGVDTPRAGGGAELIEGNSVYRNAALLDDRSGIKTFSVGTVIRYNEVFENGLDGTLNHGIQLEADSSDAHCYGNLCFGNRTAGISFTGSGHRLHHNTCDSNGESGIATFSTEVVDCEIKNNLLADNGVYSFRSHRSVALNGVRLDYNLHEWNGDPATVRYNGVDFASLDALTAAHGQESHGVEGGSRLHPSTRRVPQPSSAVGRGDASVGVTHDYAGRAYRNPPTIGAFEIRGRGS